MNRAAFLVGLAALLVSAGWAAGGEAVEPSRRPRNVILLIGDGMGYEQVKAAGLYLHGREGRLAMEQAPRKAQVRTHPAEGLETVTDSAAAATAMGTGRKVLRGVIGQERPGDGEPLRTAVEHWRIHGKMTGLVTTAYITHATPAGFGAHVANRSMLDAIAADYLERSRPNLLFGGIRGLNRKTGQGMGMTRAKAEAAGYKVVTTRKEMRALRPAEGMRVSGQFSTGHMAYEYDAATGASEAYERAPHLSEMTVRALELLSASPKGFFLMVEGARIDHAGHASEIERNIFETIEFDRTVAEVFRWAADRDDTLILVTADHECGGLRVLRSEGKGEIPLVSWSTGGHTGVNVPLWAAGPGSERVEGVLDNTDIFWLITARAEKLRLPLAMRSKSAVETPTSKPAQALR